MLIGVDASGPFAAELAEGLQCSTLAAVVMPQSVSEQIERWTEQRTREWGANGPREIHAAELGATERLQTCQWLGSRSDIRAEVVVTSALALGGDQAVSRHRALQLDEVEGGLLRARTVDGKQRAAAAVQLLAGFRRGQSRLANRDYVFVAMLPMALAGALQKAFCFFGDPSSRADMGSFAVLVDEETPAARRYTAAALYPFIAGDDRFRLLTPEHWLEEPRHPLLENALHRDGDGYDLIKLLGEDVTWSRSIDEPSVQVADLIAWVVARRMNRPEDFEAAACYEYLQPLLAGAGGRCFSMFAVGSNVADVDSLHSHLHSGVEPREWIRPR